ncbi:MAG TPA: YDG domain-containing protein, partial [Clostridia bacterium]
MVKAYYLNDLGEKVYLRVSFDKTFKNAGLYFAFASMIETDGNYELYNTDKYFEIQLRQIEVYNLIVGEQKTFDGTDIAHIISQWTTNIFDADTKLIITARYNSPNVGADTIYMSFDITGENSANYILPLDYTIKNANIKINPYIAKVYWQRESSYVYNNQDYTSTIKAWYKDIHGNNIYLDLDFGVKALINAGNYTVYAFGGDSNYQLSDNVIEIVIEKVKIQVYGLNVAP